jgi:hypothetical protein
MVRQDDVDELIDQIADITLSRMAARCSHDMVVRRNIDAVVMQIRRARLRKHAARQPTQPTSRRLMRRADRPHLLSRDLVVRWRERVWAKY